MTSVAPASGGWRRGRRGRRAGLWPMGCSGAGPAGDRTRTGEWRPLESGSIEGRAKFLSPARDRGQPSPLRVCARVCECVCARSGEGAGRVRGTRRGSGGLAGLQIRLGATSEPWLWRSAPTRRPVQLHRTSESPSSAGTAKEGPTPPQTQSLADYKVKLTRDNKSTDPRTRARRSRGRWCPLTPGEEPLAW